MKSDTGICLSTFHHASGKSNFIYPNIALPCDNNYYAYIYFNVSVFFAETSKLGMLPPLGNVDRCRKQWNSTHWKSRSQQETRNHSQNFKVVECSHSWFLLQCNKINNLEISLRVFLRVYRKFGSILLGIYLIYWNCLLHILNLY